MSIDFFVESQHTAALKAFHSRNMNFMPHLHGQTEIIYSLKGEGIITIERKPHTMRAGEAAICWPNCVHSFAMSANCTNEYYLAIFDPSLLGEIGAMFSKFDCNNPFIPEDRVHPDVKSALKNISEDPAMSPGLRRAYATIVVGRLLEGLELIECSHREDHDALHRILAYIQAHFCEPISLDSLARAMYLNKYYVSKLFSEHIGCNLHTYLNALRVSMAQGLLSDSAMSVDDIIARCGYESERTFYRAFRERTGTTPRQYREGKIK